MHIFFCGFELGLFFDTFLRPEWPSMSKIVLYEVKSLQITQCVPRRAEIPVLRTSRSQNVETCALCSN